MKFITAQQVQTKFDASNPITPGQYADFIETEINKLIRARGEQLGYGDEVDIPPLIHKKNHVASLSLWNANITVIADELTVAGYVVRVVEDTIFIELP